MFTLITDENLRKTLSDIEFLRRLHIINSYGSFRIIVRDDYSKASQHKTLMEINNLKSKFMISAFNDVKIFVSCNLEDLEHTNISNSLTYIEHMDKSSESNRQIKYIYNDLFDGLHIASSKLSGANQKTILELKKSELRIGSSIHSIYEYDEISKQNIEYLLVSAVFLTKCKKGIEAISDFELESVLSKAKEDKVEITALGGIGYNFSNLHRYSLFSSFAIRSLFYESCDLKSDLDRVLEVASYGD